MIAYHYTLGGNVPAILPSGVLRLASGFVETTERRALWFTTSGSFEPTAYSLDGDYETLFTHCGGAARFGVPVDRLVSYADWKRDSGVSDVMLRALEFVAASKGSRTELWHVSWEPIAIRDCVFEIQTEPHGPWVRYIRPE